MLKNLYLICLNFTRSMTDVKKMERDDFLKHSPCLFIGLAAPFS